MNARAKVALRWYIEALFHDYQDAGWCKCLIEQTQDQEFIAALKIAYQIYKEDPDIVGHYYNASRKLRDNRYSSRLKKEVLEAFRDIAEKIIKEAAELAKEKMK